MRRNSAAVLRGQTGFSLSELLVTTAILLMVSIIMATGVPAALRSYMRVVDASNAHLLLSTTATRLRDELAVANPAKIDVVPLTVDENTVQFESLESHYTNTVKWDEQKGIFLERTLNLPGAASSLEDYVLVPRAAGKGAKNDLRVEFKSIDYSAGFFTVEDLKVVDGNGNPIAGAEFDELKIRVLAAV